MDKGITTPIPGVFLTRLRVISQETGAVLHGMKMSDAGFSQFGEAYFSTVLPGKRKGWKKHRRMTLNLMVPVGCIGFVLFDDRQGSEGKGVIYEVELSRDKYFRLTIPPGIWMAFYGKGVGENVLLNIASITHDPDEAENLPLENSLIPYSWS